ncbi:hypothetical protein Rhopal_003364-T1 [Rhodotorula paludigena]|uniref:BTB domain-containing protein n=1 Tax=Rhodotorula paludigena TaxID=86838 RepID=A0AAV5GNT1_9BASI|nr:hypothetical protein Rhopal_003364-T1 [Rhodotorula paludigena]
MNIDLHALYASRAIAKARSFIHRGLHGAGGGSGGGGDGGGGGASGLSKSPGQTGGGWGGGNVDRQAVVGEVNRRNHVGLTVLHLAVVESDAWALDWVELLLGVPQLQVNLQDGESGWSALHRALYAGNIAAARLLLARDDIDLRLKDREGLTPFDVYNSTVDGTNPSSDPLAANPLNPGRMELFSWGSNRNFVLGFASDSERTNPERVALRREEGGTGLAEHEPLRVKDVSMARLHTAIVTDERRNNIRLCGYGTGGRLGPTTQTQFTFTPLRDFPQQVSSVVLSPDHTVVVTTGGDVYTFGLNRFSQLGYPLDAPTPSPFAKAGSQQEDPIQSTPRRVVAALKKEVVLGAAASRTHTAVFTADSLYTWGTNRGQLGYPIAGNAVQVLPRKVTLGITQPVIQLTATENATACLLESREVVVLYHEAYIKVAFPLEPFPRHMMAFRPAQADSKPSIRKIASCGNTFAALSSLGDVFTFTLDSGSATSAPSNPLSSSMAAFSGLSSGGGGSDGTASPGRGSRLAVKPQRIWTLRRKFTAVTDVGVGLDGSIIICTVSGHVFIRSRKFEGSSSSKGSGLGLSTPSSSSGGSGGWKFARVPYLQRVIKVAANSTGGFAALRADVPLRFIDIEGPTLARDLLALLPHWQRVGPVEAALPTKPKRTPDAVGGEDESDDEDDKDAVIERDIEVAKRLMEVIRRWDLTWEVAQNGTDAVVNAGPRSIPVHKTVLAARSPVFAQHFATHRQIDLDCSPLAAFLLVHYLYSDDFPAVWDTRVGLPLRAALPKDERNALEVGVVKVELRQLAQALDLPALVQALERQVKTPPTPTLGATLTDLYAMSSTAASKTVSSLPASLKPDVVLRLADREVKCHSVVLRARCPFFSTFFDDADWHRSRRSSSKNGVVSFDFAHLSWDVMSLVLEHIYRDAGMSLFQTIERQSADEYIDFTVRVLAAANELLLDKLKQVCSAVLRSFVTLHNVCSILCDAAFYEAHDLARACMYFLSSSMETALETGLLDDLPADLLTALTAFIRERQGARMPISRSNFLFEEILPRHKEYYDSLDVGRPTGAAKRYRPAIVPNSPRPSPSALLSPGASPQLAPTPLSGKSPLLRPSMSPNLSPSLPAVREVDEPFALDEDFLLDSSTASTRPVVISPPGTSQAMLGKRRASVAPVGSPSSASFMPLGSPPPPRLQPWQATVAAAEASKAPLDLRSIMASESAAVERRTSAPRPAAVSSPTIVGGLSASAPSWRPVAPQRASSLASIQSEQKAASTPPVPRRLSVQPTASPSSPSIRSPPAQQSPSRATPPSSGHASPALRPDSTAALGPVITPTRLPSSSAKSGSGTRTPRAVFGGSDTPWQNFERMAGSTASPVAGPSSFAAASPSPISPPADPFARPPPAGSFAAIQSEQIAQLAAVKNHQAPRSFADVMAQEQADAARREQELREEKEFLSWFEEESRRVQKQNETPAKGPKSGKKGGGPGGGKGKGKAQGKKAVGAQNSDGSDAGPSAPQPSGLTASKPSRGGGGGGGRGGSSARGRGGAGGRGRGRGGGGGPGIPAPAPTPPGVAV